MVFFWLILSFFIGFICLIRFILYRHWVLAKSNAMPFPCLFRNTHAVVAVVEVCWWLSCTTVFFSAGQTKSYNRQLLSTENHTNRFKLFTNNHGLGMAILYAVILSHRTKTYDSKIQFTEQSLLYYKTEVRSLWPLCERGWAMNWDQKLTTLRLAKDGTHERAGLGMASDLQCRNM